ncbi:MAG: RNA polymerase sigma factor [Phycisphaerae bacterium]|nr:MAG: sigma-70 family RNA polymerase sigma factor [Planctomycetia bacterium]RIK56032.1 MAG: RNA polymerase sigma factor [Nitrospira sp.]GJQ28071.1 MAG: RNA polymerase sigma factor [Phycisphaerae bacterium]
MTEADLIAQCRKGDREAQRILYTLTCDRIYRLLLRMTRRAETATDLAQDVYLRAFTRIAQFKGDSSIETWLYRIAVNEALQFLRRKEPLRLSSDSVQELASNDHEIDRTITSIDLEYALNRLDPADQAILLLRYQEGLDYHAIAEALDCAGGTVASRLNRARDRLRQILGNGYCAQEERSDAEHPTCKDGSVRAVQEESRVSSRSESE